MKKKLIRLCNAISLMLVIAFVIKTIVDFINYSSLITSAPFYVNVLVNGICLLGPALIIFLVGYIAGKFK